MKLTAVSNASLDAVTQGHRRIHGTGRVAMGARLPPAVRDLDAIEKGSLTGS